MAMPLLEESLGKSYIYRNKKQSHHQESICINLGNPWELHCGSIELIRAGQWVTGREKLNAMLFPVFPELAAEASVDPIEIDDVPHPHESVGNSMDVGCMVMAMLATYCCVHIKTEAEMQADIDANEQTDALKKKPKTDPATEELTELESKLPPDIKWVAWACLYMFLHIHLLL